MLPLVGVNRAEVVLEPLEITTGGDEGVLPLKYQFHVTVSLLASVILAVRLRGVPTEVCEPEAAGV